MNHSFDDGLPFCNEDDCTLCQILDLQRWGYGPMDAASRRGDPIDEPYYEEIPGDPTDRAAYFARRERADDLAETVRLDAGYVARVAWYHSIGFTAVE